MNATARVGVIVLDGGRPLVAERAARSAQDPGIEVHLLIVENGVTAADNASFERLHLPENRGFAGGVNAGLTRLSAEGCDRFLLLNDDAVLEAGCLRCLAEAIEDPALAAVGPVILREADDRVESRGIEVDLRWGRVRLDGHGERPQPRVGCATTSALSGVAMMLTRVALERVGPFDEDYFFSFEDVDWCLRARAAGLGVAVVLGARARHVGSQTIGRRSPDRIYYAARNHLRIAEKLLPRPDVARWWRRGVILLLNLAHALRQNDVPRASALRAALQGFTEACLGNWGPRSAASRPAPPSAVP